MRQLPGRDDGCDPIQDSDLDGIADAFDSCNGYDDSLDEDNDGISDGCDIWIMTYTIQQNAFYHIAASFVVLLSFLSILSRKLQ